MDIAHKLHIVIIVICAGDVICLVVVIGADVDHDEIGRLLRLEVPLWRVIAVDLGCAPRSIGGAVPLICLNSGY